MRALLINRGPKLKYRIFGFLTLVLLFLWIVWINVAIPSGALEKITGTIETVHDYGIERIALPTGKVTHILPKGSYLVNQFDLSPNGEDRILSADLGLVNGRYSGSGLVLFQSNNEFKNLVIRQGPIGSPSFSPDGKRIAYLVGEYPRKSKLWFRGWYLSLINSDGSSNKQYSDLFLDWFGPSWFPDGRRLAVSTYDLKIYVLDIETSTEKQIIDFGIAPVVSHDGNTIAYLSKEIDAATKEKIIKYSKMTEAEYFKIQRDKKLMKEYIDIYGSGLMPDEIYLYDMKTGQSKQLTKELWVNRPILWSPDDRYLLYNTESDLVGRQTYVLDIESGEKRKIQSASGGSVMVWRK